MLTSNRELINTQLRPKNAMNFLAKYVNEQQGADTAEDKKKYEFAGKPIETARVTAGH